MLDCRIRSPCWHLFCSEACVASHCHKDDDGDICPSCMRWVSDEDITVQGECPGCGSRLNPTSADSDSDAKEAIDDSLNHIGDIEPDSNRFDDIEPGLNHIDIIEEHIERAG